MNARPVVFSFVVPVRNDAVGLQRCLKSIAGAHFGADGWEIIVADNASIDGTVEIARAAGARVLHLPGLRVSELRNRGADVANGHILAFVDADHEIVEWWPAVAREHLASAGAAAAGAPYRTPQPASWVQRMYDAFRDHRPGSRQVEWLGSGNLAVDRAVFLSLDGFDPTLEACEDVDLCQRLRTAGCAVIADSRLASIHHGDPATLRELFRSELWRGRDNLRVSLRGSRSMRGLPSIVVPIADLACLVAVSAGLLTFSRAGVAVAMGALTIFGGLAAARGAMMFARLTSRRRFDFARALAVASVYDLARALALTLQVRHRRARSPIGAEAAQS